MGDTAFVHPLLWLAVPVLVTVLAGLVLAARERRDRRRDGDDAATLAGMARALQRPGPQ